MGWGAGDSNLAFANFSFNFAASWSEIPSQLPELGLGPTRSVLVAVVAGRVIHDKPSNRGVDLASELSYRSWVWQAVGICATKSCGAERVYALLFNLQYPGRRGCVKSSPGFPGNKSASKATTGYT
jgi:hypothetical protein